MITVTTGFNHDAVTTYDYDHRGHLVAVTVPDPSQDSTATVTYTYAYDSLGRPTSMRRPPVGGATATGVDLTYDGLVHERTEVAGSAGGPEARTRLVHDVHGRLLEVHEYLDAANAAVTLYAYDAGDRVERIENADGVVTELFHDFGGRRIRIERHERAWTYEYNPSGEMTTEVAPAPGGGPDLAYTTTFAYDALGRQSSRSVGTRGLSGPDLSLLGIGTITFTHDTCTNGVGRLCQVSFPNGVLTTSLSYDAEGNVAEERRQFDFAGVTGERVASTTYGPGGKVREQTYGDHSVVQTGGINLPLDDGTRARFDYDQRHLPLLVQWERPNVGPTTVGVQVRNVAGQVTRRETHLLTSGWNEFGSEWQYDALTRVVSQTVAMETPGGKYEPPQTVVLAKQQLEYFGQDDPSRLRHWLGAAYYDFAFGFDRRHQLASVAEQGGRMDAAYAFTTAGKLANAIVTGTPAPGGELVERKVTYEYASPADPEAVSALHDSQGTKLRSYTYDTVGSMVTRSAGGGTPEAFVYDGEDQLRRATRPGAGIEEYFYDHAGHRAAVVARDAGGAVESVRVFFGDAEVVLSPSGLVTKSHAHLSLGTPVARITNLAQLELQYHGLANNTLLAVAPDGEVRSGFVYGPYGELLESTGTAVADQHRLFNDKFKDDLTQLSYYGVRYYDNLLLGWTQADPMYRFVPDAAWDEPRRGLLYAFSGNNPLRYLDPDGRDWKSALRKVNKVRKAVSYYAPGSMAMRGLERTVDVARSKKSLGSYVRETASEGAVVAGAMVGGAPGVALGVAIDVADALASGGSAGDAAVAAATGALLARATGETFKGLGKVGAKALKALKPCSCFVAGTLVHVEEGTKPIEQVAVGDLVWARNIYTEAVELRPVLDVFVRLGAPIVEVSVAGPDGERETLRTTAEHPLWTARGWVEVADLQPGDSVHLGGRGRGTVVSLTPTGQHETVYNFTVGEFHTYYVGNLATLVHNCGKVYKVDGSNTPSGKPYVGRTKQSSPAKRGKRDGRDRKDAEIVDTYDGNDTAAGRRAEQRAINREGGVDNLDNKRNEIRSDDWQTNDIDPPRQQ